MQQEVLKLNNPFIVVVNGERIYEGDIKNSLSSMMSLSTPKIRFFQSIGQTHFQIEASAPNPLAYVPEGARLIGRDATNLVVHTADGKTNIIHWALLTDARNHPRILRAIEGLSIPSTRPDLPWP